MPTEEHTRMAIALALSRRAGTMALGEKHGAARLTEEQVRIARARKISSYKLSQLWGIPPSTIRAACNYNWRHLR